MNINIYSRKEMEFILQNGILQNKAVISFYDPIESYSIEKYSNGVGASSIKLSFGEKEQDDDNIFMNYRGEIKYYFQIWVLDINYYELEDYGLSYSEFFPEVDELAKFIKKVVKEEYDIICQCEYGQGRSAGCAAAILEYYEHSGIKIFANYKYCPNQMIFNKLYKALSNCIF